MKQLNITLLRHGETTLNKHLIGVTNSPLTQRGWQQMSRALSASDKFDQIITSPLIRCHDFAKSYVESINGVLTIDKNLQELDFGDWDGKSYQELWQQPNTKIESFYRDPWQQTPPNGEALATFCERVDQAWRMLLRQQGEVLVICHGGVIRYLMAKILGMPLPGNRHLVALNIPHGALIKIAVTIDDDGEIWPTIEWPS